MKLMSTLTLLGIAFLPDLAEAKSGADCKAIDELISANEEFVESILEDDAKLGTTTRQTMTTGLAGLGKTVSVEAQKASKLAISTLDAALAAGNTEAAMLAALQNYAVLVADLKNRLPTSQNVAMLDHAGFSLQALAASGSPDWAKLKAVQSALGIDVKAINGQLGKGPLADLMNHTAGSIDAAIAETDPKWLNASAQILLDSVDLVEAVVKNRSATACR